MAKREYKVKAPALVPVLPGELLREDVLPATGLSISATARALGVSRQTLHAVLAERQAVTPEMALRLGKFFGNGPKLWLNMQQAYDLWHASDDLAEILKEIETVQVV